MNLFKSTSVMKSVKIQYFIIIVLLSFYSFSFGQTGKYINIVFGCYTSNLNDFEKFAVQAKEAGATHIQINAEDLPLAYWQMNPPGDPYPAWVISNPGLLKTFIPKSLEKYIPKQTANKVCNILEQRCIVLRKHKLKAAFHTFEPQMLPESVYEDHPNWRGPQVDHPMRSRTPRFSPSIDNPEVLKLYTESMKNFISRCPEVEILYFRTNDSGAGLDWSIGLYNGSNGNTNYKHRTMQERVRDFLAALQEGAAEAGGTLAVNIYDTDEPDSKQIAKRLEDNMAIDQYEGPEAGQFKADVDNLLYYSRPFTPIVGIPRPLDFIEKLELANRSAAPRLFVAIADRQNKDLYLKIYKEFWQSPTNSIIDNLQFLKRIAQSEVEAENAEKLFELWLALHEAKKIVSLTNAGGTIFNLGCVQQRWLVRPLVPFPADLKPEEKNYYRQHQFQARSESAADYLLDLQAMRVYTGEGGYRYIHRVIYKTKEYISKATELSRYLEENVNQEQKKTFELLTIRLTAYDYLMNNVLNVVSYQTQLDQLDLSGKKSEAVAMGSGSSSARRKMLETVRREIDNTSNLISLLQSQDHIGNVIDHSKTKDEEYIRLLGPDLIDQLRKKIKIMNAHWRDYNKIFTRPNF
jgi:hypothetical protein